jgi:hypothetical protein
MSCTEYTDRVDDSIQTPVDRRGDIQLRGGSAAPDALVPARRKHEMTLTRSQGSHVPFELLANQDIYRMHQTVFFLCRVLSNNSLSRYPCCF